MYSSNNNIFYKNYVQRMFWKYFCKHWQRLWKWKYIVYFCLPFSLIALIPILICISYFNLENYELFMNYYKLCSNYYGDEFKNSLNNIMNIQKLTKNIKYSVYFEMAYHFLVFYLICAQK